MEESLVKTSPTPGMERFAARCLLLPGFIDLPVDEALGGFSLSADEEALVRACWRNKKMYRALQQFWKAYDARKEAGQLASVRAPWYD